MQGSALRRSILAAVLSVVVSGCEGGAAPAGEPRLAEAEAATETPVLPAGAIPPGVDAHEVERGRELFLPCAVCHGFDGRGNPLGPSLRDAEWIHIGGSREEIEQLVRSGVPEPEEHPVPMVPMGGGDFDPDELSALSAYVYAISRSPDGQPRAAPVEPGDSGADPAAP